VRITFSILVILGLFGASGFALAPGQQAQAKPASVAPTSIDEVLTAVRADLQGERADIVAKNMTLTSEQAAKFWPLFLLQIDRRLSLVSQLQFAAKIPLVH
jgi:hypothetical protein